MHNHIDSVGSVMFVERNSRHQETQAKKIKKRLDLKSPLSLSLPGIFEDQGSGYPLRVCKVTLKWTGPVKILPKGQLESNLINTLLST